MDNTSAYDLQVEAVRRCQDPKPISADEGRKILGLFPGPSRGQMEIAVLIARVSLDQSVRLEKSIDKLEQKSSRLSVILVVLTLVLCGLAYVTYAKI